VTTGVKLPVRGDLVDVAGAKHAYAPLTQQRKQIESGQDGDRRGTAIIISYRNSSHAQATPAAAGQKETVGDPAAARAVVTTHARTRRARIRMHLRHTYGPAVAAGASLDRDHPLSPYVSRNTRRGMSRHCNTHLWISSFDRAIYRSGLRSYIRSAIRVEQPLSPVFPRPAAGNVVFVSSAGPRRFRRQVGRLLSWYDRVWFHSGHLPLRRRQGLVPAGRPEARSRSRSCAASLHWTALTTRRSPPRSSA